MPGIESIKQNQYYAHPRNAFWPIMHKIFNIDLTVDYEDKCKQLCKHQVMVWDVIASASRKGSLDSAIDTPSILVNDFDFLLNPNCTIDTILCNGGKAYDLFNQHVVKPLNITVPVNKLPSTSPAYASIRFEQKLHEWCQHFKID